jgi:hypothetical protein
MSPKTLNNTKNAEKSPEENNKGIQAYRNVKASPQKGDRTLICENLLPNYLITCPAAGLSPPGVRKKFAISLEFASPPHYSPLGPSLSHSRQ